MISVIVPVYNTPIWLIERTLNSICTQKKDIEIIIVNDGSTDAEVVQFLRNLSDREEYRVVSKVNGGLGSARNEGLKYATGEYVSFIDSDDYLDGDFYNKLDEIAKENDADIVSALMVATDGNSYKSMDEHVNFVTDKLYEKVKNINHGSVCNKVFRRILFDDVKFPENHLYWEDNIVLLELYIKSKIVAFTRETTYFYWNNPNSITRNNSFLDKQMNDSLTVLEMIKNMAQTVDDEEKQFIIKRFLSILFKKEFYKNSKEYRNRLHTIFTIDELECVSRKIVRMFTLFSLSCIKITKMIDVESNWLRNNNVIFSLTINNRQFCFVKNYKC